jgi:Tfp pilus assembly protein PilP
MHIMKNIIVLGMLAALAAAQAKPVPKTPAPAPAKPMPSSQKVVPAPAKSASVAAKPAPVAAKPAPKAMPAKAAPAKSAAKFGANPGKPAVKTASARNKRDPFLSPVRMQGGRDGQPACTTGPKCLMIQQVVLKGVVKTQGGMIAMVENAAKKQYNLREKDPVFNGFVLKITSDSIVFRETVTDLLGNASSREVVKRVTVPAV